MNEIEIFTSKEFGELRSININGKPYFCGSDVAKALGYVIPSKALNTHCKGVSKMEVPTNGGKQEMLFIPESDIYRLIIKSKLPSAEKFESWVFDEVLPTIQSVHTTNEIILQNQNGEILVSSRDIADKFNKNHKDVLESIRNLTAENPAIKIMFNKSEYKNDRGRIYDEYLMNRDGFSLLTMGFTGKKALEWKLKYIEAFNEMEKVLKHGHYLSEEETLRLQLFSKDSLEVVAAHNKLLQLEVNKATKPLLDTIEEQKPSVEFANKVSNSSNLINMGQMAKLLKDNDMDIGRNRLFVWLRSKEILMSDNTPYQRYVDSGYFKVIESVCGTKTQLTTLITGKGQIYITEKLRKEFGEVAS